MMSILAQKGEHTKNQIHPGEIKSESLQPVQNQHEDTCGFWTKRADKGGQVERRGLWHDGETLHTINPTASWALMKIETTWSADESQDYKGGQKTHKVGQRWRKSLVFCKPDLSTT